MTSNTPGPDIVDPDSALAIAAEIEQVIFKQNFIADQFSAARTVSHIAAGRPFTTAPEPAVILPPAEMSTLVHSAAIGRLWRRSSRIACLVDPTMAQEIHGATSDVLPTGIFRALPYINPLIVFADPVACVSADDLPARLLGFYVYGLNGHGTGDAAFTTTDTDPPHLAIMAVLRLSGGENADHELNRLAIPMNVDRLTLSEFITHTAHHHPVDVVTAVSATESSVRDGIESVLRPALSALLYLCTRDADLTAHQQGLRSGSSAHRSKSARSRKASKDAVFVQVGWRLGATLRRFQAARRAHPDSDPTPTGRTQPPRQRASHFKTVWVGRGRETPKTPKTVFVLPYWIHKDQLDPEATPATLVPTAQHPTGRTSRRRRSRTHRPRQ